MSMLTSGLIAIGFLVGMYLILYLMIAYGEHFEANATAFAYGVVEFRRVKTFRFAPLNRKSGDWSAFEWYQRGQRFGHWLTFGYWS